MRPILSCSLLSCFLLPAMWADGVPVRQSPLDYPVQQESKSGSFAAIPIKSDIVRRMFSPEVDKNFVVVEVAVFPKDGAVLDLDSFDFALRFGPDVEVRPDVPEVVAGAWKERNDNTLDRHGVHVTGETGVIYASGRDPVTGRSVHGVGTYEDVGVGIGNAGQAPPPVAPPSGNDPRMVENHLREKALPEGKTSNPVAGYLYFRKPSHKPKDRSLELKYFKNGTSVALALPGK